MAAIKFRSALGVERGYENGFGGIDRTPKGRESGGLFSAKNMEVRSDGSLASRRGYRQVRALGGEYRGYFSSGNLFYSVEGNSLKLTDTASGSTRTLGTLPTDGGNAEIFSFRGDTFVHDGEGLYRYDGERLSAVEGYAPYYGASWNPSTGGKVNEDINFLSDRIMISYTVTQTTNSFYLGIKAKSIDHVMASYVDKDPEDFTLTTDESGKQIIKASSPISQGEIYFWLTLAPEESKKSKLSGNLRAFVFGGGGGKRLCFYSPGRSGHLYCSIPVGGYILDFSSISAENEFPLYFSERSALCIGDGSHPITGMASHYDRALLFTEYNAWCVDYDGEESNSSYLTPKAFMLNSAIGSEIGTETAYCENDPLTYACGALWRWHSRSGVIDECSATLLTSTDSGLLPKETEELLLVSLPHKQKIFICDPEDGEGRILVYDTRLGTWSAYGDIFAEALVRYGRELGFVRGGALCVFNDDLTEDVEDDGSYPIKCAFSTDPLDFGSPERTKRRVSLVLSSELGETGADVSFENERGEVTLVHIDGGRQLISDKISLPRFKELRFSFSADAPAVCRYLILSAK